MAKLDFADVLNKYPNGVCTSDLSPEEQAKTRAATRASIANGVHSDIASDFGVFGLVVKPVDSETEKE